MALIDVKEYYYTMLNQYLEMKNDLEDFNQAFRDGHITEDQLVEVKNDFAEVERNYNRLSYIMYLFELPRTKKRKAKYMNNKANKALEDELINRGADVKTIKDENESVIAHLRAELKKLTKNN